MNETKPPPKRRRRVLLICVPRCDLVRLDAILEWFARNAPGVEVFALSDSLDRLYTSAHEAAAALAAPARGQDG